MKRPAVLIATGFLLRLAIMPLAFHGDLLFVHYFPYHLSHHGIWDIYGYFGGHYLERGYTYYAPMVYYSMALFQWLLGPLNPDFGAFMSSFHEKVYNAAFSASDFMVLVPKSAASYQIFWMKLPYFILDAASLFLLWRLFEKKENKQKAVIFWSLSPVVILSNAWLGQYRSMTVIMVLAMLLSFYENRVFLGGFFLGFLLMMENFPFLLVLPALLIFPKDWRQGARLLLAIAGPYLAVMLPLAASSKGYVWQVYFSPIVRQMAGQSIFRHYPVQTAIVCKLIFLSVLAVLMKRFFEARKNNPPPEERFRLFYLGGFMILFALYATTTTHIHYMLWALPFFLLVDLNDRPWPLYLPMFLFLFLFLFNFHSLGLELPGLVVATGRLLFSFLCLYFCWRAWQGARGAGSLR